MLSQGRRELEEGIPIGLPLSIEKIIGSCAYDLAEAQRQGVRKSHTLSHTPESFPEVSQLALAPPQDPCRTSACPGSNKLRQLSATIAPRKSLEGLRGGKTDERHCRPA